MSKGWISLHRQFQDHWLWTEPRKYSKGEAWLDILMSAAHKEHKAVINDNLITCERGEWIASIRFLQKRWQWSNSKIVKFLLVLEKDDMLTLEKKTGVTVLKVSKYNSYQDPDEIKKTAKRQERDGKATPRRQQSDKDNNGNNENNDNNLTLVSFETQPTSLESQIVEAWNKLPDPIRTVRGSIPKAHRQAFSARSKDPDFLADWQEAMESIRTDDHCLGRNERQWVATIGYFLKPDTVEKLLSRKAGREAKPNGAHNGSMQNINKLC